MITQFVNFDIKPLLPTSDGEHVSELGRQKKGSSNGQNDQQFSDEFLKAGITAGIKAEASDETELPEAAVNHKDIVNTTSDETPSSVKSLELPFVGLPEKGDIRSNNTEYRLPDDIEDETLSEQLPAQSIRKSTGLSFNDWETDFVATGAVSDNFTAVESAISRRLALNEDVEPLVVENNVKTNRQEAVEPLTSRSIGNLTAIDINLTDHQYQETIVAPHAIANAGPSIEQEKTSRNLLAPVQQEIAPIEPGSSSLSPITMAQQSHYNGVTELQSGRGSDVNRPLRSEADQVFLSIGAREKLNDLPAKLVKSPVVDIQPETDLTNAQQSFAPKAVEESSRNEINRIKTPLVRHDGERNTTIQSLVDREMTELGPAKTNAQAPEKQENTATASRFFSNRERPLVSPELPLKPPIKPLADNQKIDRSAIAALTADVAQPTRVEAQPKTTRSSLPDQSNIVSNRPNTQNALAYQIKKTPQVKVENISKDQAVEIGFRGMERDTAIENSTILSSPPSGDRNALQQSKIVDSLNLRLGNKAASDRPSIKAPPTEVSETIVVENEQATMNVELQTGINEKISPISQPMQAVSPAVATTAQKTVSFDWNSPKFAERFAAEIGDLNINGDLKKFEINPRNLGRLEVAFVARGGSEVIRIEAESQAARDVIVQHSQAIQDILKAQGRPDVSIRVDLRDGSFASNAETNNQNLPQQDGTEAQEDRPNAQPRTGRTLATDVSLEPETARDEGRYA